MSTRERADERLACKFGRINSCRRVSASSAGDAHWPPEGSSAGRSVPDGTTQAAPMARPNSGACSLLVPIVAVEPITDQ